MSTTTTQTPPTTPLTPESDLAVPTAAAAAAAAAAATVTAAEAAAARARRFVRSCLQDDKCQKKFVFAVVPVTLFLVNVLNGSVTAIMTKYLLAKGIVSVPSRIELVPVTGPLASVFQRELGAQHPPIYNATSFIERTVFNYDSSDFSFGFLYAIKSMFQLVICPKSGALVEKRGTDITMILGLSFLFAAGVTFAYGENYFASLVGRAIQGCGSGFVETAALALVACVLRDKHELYVGVAVIILFVASGIIYSSRFGDYMYLYMGKTEPFLLLSSIFLSLALIVLIVRPVKARLAPQQVERVSIPIWFLLMDPNIILISGALIISRLPPAFLEQTLGVFLRDHDVPTFRKLLGMDSSIQSVALLASVVLGVTVTYKFVMRYPQYQWVLLIFGFVVEGTCTFLVPVANCCWKLIAVLCGICFSLAIIDMVLLPTLAALVDARYLSSYGRIYALVNMCYNVNYAIAPVTSKRLLQISGFSSLMYFLGVCTVLYAPLLAGIRSVYVAESRNGDVNEHQPLQQLLTERAILLEEPPELRYYSFAVQDMQSRPR